MTAPAKPPVLSLRGITRRFGSLVANDDISLELGEGEVLALLGENGAGKSTLVSILFGHYVADAGTIEAFGRPLPPGDPAAALAAGIGMVHQHFTLADNLSVLENVLIGVESLWRPFSDRRGARARLLELSQRFGLAVDPHARVADLSIGERQRVEILKALYRDARILILDEPTAVLTPQESERLFATLHAFVQAGLSIIFISHKLNEVMAVSHRVAVLRQGRLQAVLAVSDTDAGQLAKLMIGRDVVLPRRRRPAGSDVLVTSGAARTAAGAGAGSATAGGGASAAALALRDVCVGPPGRRSLDSVSFAVAPGEIVAIAGVAGNGQQALADLLCGLLAADSGEVCVSQATLAADPRAWIRAGVGRVPEDRQHLGVVGEASVTENAVAERYREAPYAHHGFVDRSAMREAAQAIVREFDVRCRNLEQPARQLSGGNMQKLIIGRVLSRAPMLLIANQPTWGLDVGAVAEVHDRLLAASGAGCAVLLISEELDEIFALADRIAVISHGRLSPARAAADWTTESLGLAMAGAGVGLAA